MKLRLTALFFAAIAAFTLITVTVTLAAKATSPDDAETRREQSLALAAEAGEAVLPLSPRANVDATAMISAPLFVGVDNTDEFTYAVDPQTGTSFKLFDGTEVWGAAYDWRSEIVYMVSGSVLVAWPLGGTPTPLGTIYGGEVPTTTLSFVSLAYYDDTLYATRNVGSDAFPEGGYTIDPDTLQATLVFTFSVGADAADIGGLAANPLTGELYGTNDDADMRGLVQLALDGTMTFVAPYPAGQTDIDGLAISKDGRAYLVIDQPGDVYVFDFDTLTYTLPISNPWKTSNIFSGGAWVEEMIPSIEVTKTVGLDPDECATENEIEVAYGTEVTYCYRVNNTGDIALNNHDLVDDKLGPILDDFFYTLAPAATSFITQSAVITQTTLNTATWTAYNDGPADVVTDTAEALVTLIEPSITFTKTVGLDPESCATQNELTLEAAADVTYCYEVTNSGTLTLTMHNLVDSELGQLLTDYLYELGPAQSVFITETVEISQTTVNTATWSAYTSVPEDGTEATTLATVIIGEPEAPRIAVEPGSISTTLNTDSFLVVPLTISNTGSLALTWTITEATPNCMTPAALDWVDVDPPAGFTLPGGSSAVLITLDSNGIAPGVLTGAVCITSNDADAPVTEVPLELVITEPEFNALFLPIVAGSPLGMRTAPGGR